MEINPANKIFFGLTEQIYKDNKRQAQEVESPGDISFDKSFEKYVTEALSIQPSDSVDIEQIRREMNSGQLDSPEAIRQAAQNMLDQGI